MVDMKGGDTVLDTKYQIKTGRYEARCDGVHPDQVYIIPSSEVLSSQVQAVPGGIDTDNTFTAR